MFEPNKAFHIKSKDYKVNMQKYSFHRQNQHIDTTTKEYLNTTPNSHNYEINDRFNKNACMQL